MARKVSYVYQGSESPERFELLVSLTGLRSPIQIGALRDHLVKGVPLGGALVEKLVYTTQRADHKREARAADDGKKF